jgi:hypothetical protein
VTWLNPWAWVGLAALAVPVAIHFLTRAQPRPLPFPTLRFLTVATTSAMRRRMLRDRALLAVRMGILAAVVAALAQPYVATAGRRAAGASTVARAIVIDTSASMNRTTADGRHGIDLARERARTLEPAAASTTTIDANVLGDGIAEGVTWLARRGGRGELAVVSDFQAGSVSASDLSRVPASMGVALVKIDVPAVSSTVGPSTRVGTRLWTPHLTLDASRTSVTWTTAEGSNSRSTVRVVGAPADTAVITTATAAADALGVPEEPAAHPVVIELAGAPAPAAPRAIDAPWMFDAIERIRTDAALQAAAQSVTAKANEASALSVVARDAAGTPLVAAGTRGGDLVLHDSTSDPLFLAALIRAADNSSRDASAIRELEPTSIAPEVLAGWQRPLPSSGAPAPDDPTASDGRWFWLAALALFGVETWMRRPQARATITEVQRARVA